MLSVEQHTELFIGRARFPEDSRSSRKSVLSRPTYHAKLPHCPRLSSTENPKLLCIPFTKSYIKTPYLQEKVGLRSCWYQSTVLPLTLQGFRRGYVPIAYLGLSLGETVDYTQNSVPNQLTQGRDKCVARVYIYLVEFTRK